MDAHLYVIWSADRKKAYVGETTDIARRLKQHRAMIAFAGGEVVVTPAVGDHLQRLQDEYELAKHYESQGVTIVSLHPNATDPCQRCGTNSWYTPRAAARICKECERRRRRARRARKCTPCGK